MSSTIVQTQRIERVSAHPNADRIDLAVVDGKERDVYKQPKTDSKKNSKRGRLALVKDNGQFKTVPKSEASKYESGNLLVEVFRDGQLLVDQSFDDIRIRAQLQ